MKSIHQRPALILIGLSILLTALNCSRDSSVARDASYVPPIKRLAPIGYSIQVGAFANLSNAAGLAEKLQDHGVDAYHFVDHSGLYKVRFGNWSSKNQARSRAENLKIAAIIDAYYIIGPNDYTAAGKRHLDNTRLRNEIVKTAKQYIGIPYRWGGKSAGTGFDCSGLTMAVYRLNGLDLPRSSMEQWRAGKPINRSNLSKGDLVFFATAGGRKVSHVGIYTGNNKFLHAPGEGRNVRLSSLSNKYYKSRYLGARRYL